MRGFGRGFGIILGVMLGVLGHVAQAQEQKVWVQIDAQPTLSAAMDRARAYAGVLEQVQGYRLPSGAYAIVLGPMGSDAAVTELQSLMAQNMIAADSDDGIPLGSLLDRVVLVEPQLDDRQVHMVRFIREGVEHQFHV